MVTRGSKFVRIVWSWRYGGGGDFAALYRMEAAYGPYSGTRRAKQARDHQWPRFPLGLAWTTGGAWNLHHSCDAWRSLLSLIIRALRSCPSILTTYRQPSADGLFSPTLLEGTALAVGGRAHRNADRPNNVRRWKPGRTTSCISFLQRCRSLRNRPSWMNKGSEVFAHADTRSATIGSIPVAATTTATAARCRSASLDLRQHK